MPHVDHLTLYTPCMTIGSEFLACLMITQKKDSQVQTMVIDDQAFPKVGGLIYESRNRQSLLVIPYRMQNEVIRNSHKIGHFGNLYSVSLLNKFTSLADIRQHYSINYLRNRISRIVNNGVPCILGNILTYSRFDRWIHQILLVLSYLESNNQRGYWSINYSVLFMFGNPDKLVSNRETAFTSENVHSYCLVRNIRDIFITNGMPRLMGMLRDLIPLLYKY